MRSFVLRFFSCSFAWLACAASVLAQAEVGRLTPVRPSELLPRAVEVPAAFASRLPSNPVLNLPEGYRARVFYAGPQLVKPRFMAWGPDSVLHVADVRGNIFALPDADRDGVADRIVQAAANVFAHDVKFHQGRMYAAEERRVLELTDDDGDGVYENRRVFIDGIAAGAPQGGHSTRTILFDTLSQTIFLSIGSLCNVCREDRRAVIEAYDLDGGNRRIYATGARNAVGLAQNPRTGRIWATNNGSDGQGDNVPSEWIDLVREGGFYGYPFAYGDGLYFDFTRPQYRDLLPLTAEDSSRVASMTPPAGLIQAHSAPMAIEFGHAGWREPYRNGAFVALRGSWNRSVATGSKIVYLQLENERDSVFSYVQDFVTGFLTDSVRSQRWARPVGLLTDAAGSLYMTSDDVHSFVLLVEPTVVSSVNGPQAAVEPVLRLAPDPARGVVRATLSGPWGAGAVEEALIDAAGRTVWTRSGEAAGVEREFSMDGRPAGVYLYRLRQDGRSLAGRFVW